MYLRYDLKSELSNLKHFKYVNVNHVNAIGISTQPQKLVNTTQYF